MSTNLTIPNNPIRDISFEEQTMLFEIPERERNIVLDKMILIERALKLGGSCKAFKMVCGNSWYQIREASKRYKRYGICALIRNWKSSNKVLPDAFIQFWKEHATKSSRYNDGIRAAYDELCRMWYNNEYIPGYGKPIDWWAEKRKTAFPSGSTIRLADLPPGWSYRNLLFYIPETPTRSLKQRGFAPSHSHLQQLLRDRSKLRPLELITFDDVRLDIKAVFKNELTGKHEVDFIWAVCALDVATGCIIGQFTKARGSKEDGSGKVGINRSDVMQLICNLLEQYGLPPYEVTLLLENASAALNKEDVKAIQLAFCDRVKIDNTPMIRKQLTKEGFIQECGSPWAKGWIEATFRALHTRMALLPGSTGNRYNNDPVKLLGAVHYTEKLLRDIEKSGADVDAFRFPILNYNQVHDNLLKVIGLLNFRTEHGLQGFEEVTEFRIEGHDWMPIEQSGMLTDDQQALAEWHVRLESPIERLERLVRMHRIQFHKVNPAVIYTLSLEKFDVTPKNGQITLRKKHVLPPEGIVFRSDHPVLRDDKTEYLAFLSQDKQTLHLLHPKHKTPVASIPRYDRIDVTSEPALQRAMGAVARNRDSEYQRVDSISQQENQFLHDVKEHNRIAFAGFGNESAKMIAAEEKHSANRKKAKANGRDNIMKLLAQRQEESEE